MAFKPSLHFLGNEQISNIWSVFLIKNVLQLLSEKSLFSIHMNF